MCKRLDFIFKGTQNVGELRIKCYEKLVLSA